MQVQERAMEVYGSEEEMEKARLKKVERREKQQQKKFDKNVQGNGFQICHKMQQAQKQEQFLYMYFRAEIYVYFMMCCETVQ